MEYEIEDDALLFDESTNPSLRHENRRAIDEQKPKEHLGETRRLQKAERIPDEEEGLQAA